MKANKITECNKDFGKRLTPISVFVDLLMKSKCIKPSSTDDFIKFYKECLLIEKVEMLNIYVNHNQHNDVNANFKEYYNITFKSEL
jgi:hypothetical protein